MPRVMVHAQPRCTPRHSHGGDTDRHVRTLTQVTHGMHCARTMMNLSTLGNFSTFELASDLMLSSSLITLRSSDGSRASPIA